MISEKDLTKLASIRPVTLVTSKGDLGIILPMFEGVAKDTIISVAHRDADNQVNTAISFGPKPDDPVLSIVAVDTMSDISEADAIYVSDISDIKYHHITADTETDMDLIMLTDQDVPILAAKLNEISTKRDSEDRTANYIQETLSTVNDRIQNRSIDNYIDNTQEATEAEEAMKDESE